MPAFEIERGGRGGEGDGGGDVWDLVKDGDVGGEHGLERHGSREWRSSMFRFGGGGRGDLGSGNAPGFPPQVAGDAGENPMSSSPPAGIIEWSPLII